MEYILVTEINEQRAERNVTKQVELCNNSVQQFYHKQKSWLLENPTPAMICFNSSLYKETENGREFIFNIP